MKFKNYLLTVILLLSFFDVLGQNLKAFSPPRFDRDINGDMLLIGNNILNRDGRRTDPNDPYDGGGVNSEFDMQYIDIDSDASTFSSSSANLDVPNYPDVSGNNCYRIVYAGLYWGAILQGNGDRSTINQVKFKLPVGGYNNITGQIVYDAAPVGIGTDNSKAYVCYADVTSLLNPTNPEGAYTVANVLSSTGGNGGTGLSAGWSLFIVYEDPTATSKSIVSYDGFSGIDAANNLDITISNFRTIPAGPVNAKLAFSAIEGDQDFSGDYLQINGTLPFVSSPGRAANNFFNSSVSTPTGPFLNRTPNSENTLGYDAGVININNPANSVIANNATSAVIRLGSNQDFYFYFFNAFAIDIIAPQILLTKQVRNTATGALLAQNGTVNLGDYLTYEIGFQNTGNDNAVSFTIKDVLPINVMFNPLTDLTLPAGVTLDPAFLPYNPVTRTLGFIINNNLVEENDPRYLIQIRVRVVTDCNLLSDVCSNLIQNQAFATYSGAINTSLFSDEGSIASFGNCNIATPNSTNFLANIDNCAYAQNAVICGNAGVQLEAANGYTTYTWTGPAGAVFLPNANSQIVTVNLPGVYTVNNVAPAPCRSIVETFTVTQLNPSLPNPVIDDADIVINCVNDNKPLPQIFLCGASAFRDIDVNIAGAVSIVWQKLNEPCTVVPPTPLSCANESPTCSWTQIATGVNYTATIAGQYRILITFAGNCVVPFYFNVYQDILNPTATPTDIICTTPGQIIVNGVPAGYEYSLSDTTGGLIPGTYVPGNIFSINVPGNYTVYIRQTGITGGCVFQINNINIRVRDFSVTATPTQPLCNGGTGSVLFAVNNVEPQYTYMLYQGTVFGGPLVNQVVASANNTATFTPLNPGNYFYVITTDEGCSATGTFTINNPPVLTITAGITTPLTPCTPGQITVYPVGGTPVAGTPPYYFYYVNSTTLFQTTPIISAPTAGNYTIYVVDANNCRSNTIVVNVPNNPPPVFAPTRTNVLCYGNNTGQINFNVSNANGYTLAYSINGGGTYIPNQPIFSNLTAGTYSLIIRYTLLNAICFTTPQTLIITQPFEALTASGGIAQVACATNGGNAIVRITNVQGGTGTYQYNFGAGYQALNTGQLPPGGPYTIYVRDANLCEFPMTVTIAPIPAPPTISISPPSFSCNGSATSTVTVNNILPGQYTYSYALDGVLNTPPTNNIFTNVPCGPHNIDVNYALVAPPTFSNLLNETFGSGANTTTPGIAAAYCWNNQPYAPNRPCGNSRPAGFVGTPPCNDFTIEDNEYDVTSAINPNNCRWFPFRDHTSNATDPNGRFLAINIGSAAGANGVLYSKVINNILPNQPVIVEAYVANLFLASFGGGVDPSFSFELVDSLGNILAQQPPIPPTPNPTGIPPVPTIPRTNTWQLRSVSLNPGNNTTLTFRVRSGSILFNGNDAGIDDIRVYQLPATCLTTRVFPIAIPCNQAFTAQVTGHTDVTCFGANNGTVTIAAQNFNTTTGFQYNVGNGWMTSLVSPVTVPINLVTYTPQQVQIRYDSNPANAACIVTIPQVILVPSAIVASASATAATCLVGSTVTASATGGTGAYQYQLTGTTNPVTVPISIGYQSSPTFNNIAPGTYIVNVRDANGCIDPINTPIVIAPVGNPTISLTGSNLCINPSGQASIVLTGSGGSGIGYTYAVVLAPGPLPLLSGYISSNIFPITVAGTYLVSVADSNGCISIATSQVIAPALSVNTVLTNGIDCIAPTNALISGTITGGFGPYTVTPNTGVTVTGSTFTFTTNTGGNYQFTVTDAVGCTAQSIVIPVINYGNPTATQITTPASCVGLNTGSATVTPSLGLAPYTVTLNAITDSTAPYAFINLGAGTYPYIVTDANGCTFTGSAVVAGPAPIVAIANITVPYNCDNGATIVAQGNATIGSPVTGGTGTYSYSLYLGATLVQGPQLSNPIFTNILTPGSYTIRITDTNGCLFTTNAVVINSLNPPTDMVFVQSALSCSTILAENNTSDVTITTTGGIGVLSYQMIVPATLPPTAVATVNGFNNLPVGNYTIRVIDANNCEYDESFQIIALPAITAIGNTTANVRCRGEANGSGTFTVSGTTNYTYTIAPFAGYAGVTNVPSTLATITLGSLIAGTYNITITDVNTTCTATGSFTVNEPAVAFAFTAPTIVPIQCSPSSGSVAINTVGGWPGSFTYTLTPPVGAAIVQVGTPPTANTFNNLTQGGTYTISVQDFNGCTITDTFSLTAPATPLVVVSPLSDLCFDSIGLASITAVASNGVSPYTFSLNGGAFAVGSTATSITYTGLAANTTYTIITRDAFGCQSVGVSQTINPQLTLTFGVTKPLDCSASPNAVINGIISGGTAPYTIVPSGVGVLSQTGSTFTYTTAVAASYTFTVTDSTGATLIPAGTPCSVTNSTTVSPLIVPDIVSAVQSAPILCNGASTGALTIVVNSGLPYDLDVNNDTTGINYSNTTTGLPAGNYTITARIPAPNSCFDTQTVSILQPDPITFTGGVVQIICQPAGLGNSVGEVSATGVAGGTGLYTYTLINNATGLPAGLGTSGPTALTSYSFVLSNTAFGSYTITVADANGCSASSIQTIARPVDDIITTSVLPSNCTTASLKVCVAPLGGGPYYFAIYTGAIIPYPASPGTYQASDSPIVGNPDYLCSTFTGLNPDTLYSFVVYDDATKCYYQEVANSPTPTSSTMTSVVTPKDITCSGAANGDVSFVFSNNYPLLTDVNWQVYNVSTTPVLPVITGTVTGLLSTPLTTTIINTTVNSLVPVNTPGPLAPGTYYIQFTEIGGANPGCIKNSAPFTIEQSLAPLTLNAVETTKDSCETNDGVITATAQFGTPPYLYQIAPDTGVAGVVDGTDVNLSVVSAYNAFSATFSAPANLPSTFNQESGNYIVYVKDAKGCIVSDFVNLGLFLDPTVGAILDNACVTQNNFSITATVTAALGVPPYSVTLDGGAPQSIGSTVGSTFTFSNVSSLTSPHIVTINDANGCGNTVSVTILNPLAVTASFTTPPICDTNTGVITPIITPATGTQPTPAIGLFNPTSSPPLTFSGTTFANVPPGTYVITLTDPITGCPATTTVSFAAPTPVTFTAANVVVTSPNCAAIPGNISNGTLTVNLPAVNNNPVYTYTVTQTFAPFAVYGPLTTNFFSGLVAGIYNVRVDSGTCTLTVPVTIPSAPLFSASTFVSLPTCSLTNTLNPTEVSVNGLGGSGTYFYSTTGAIGTYFATNLFYVIDTGLVQNLTYFVKDSNGCETTATATVNPFPKLISAIATQQTRITCDNAGEVVLVTVAGGSTPLSYTWEVATNGAAFTGVGTTPFNTATFTYTIPTAGTTTYQFQIVDVATGCSIVSNVYNVPVFNTLVATANTVSQVDCFGNSTGTIALNVTGYTGSYTYQVLNGGLPVPGASGTSNTSLNPFLIPTGLPAGTYTVFVDQGANYPNCDVTSNSVTIGQPAAATTIGIVSNLNANCNSGAIVTVQGANGTPGYGYAFGPTGFVPVAADYSTLSSTSFQVTIPTAAISPATDGYVFWVRDSNGCENSIPVLISRDPDPTITLNPVTDQCTSTGSSYTFTVSGTGVGILTYAITAINGNPVANTYTTFTSFTVPGPGLYTVSVKDGNGCIVASSTNVDIKPPLTINAVLTTETSCVTGTNGGAVGGVITITTTGGSGTYTYVLNPPTAGVTFVLPNTFTNVPSGSYTVTVTDLVTLCPLTSSTVVVGSPTPITFDPATTANVICIGDSNGTIQVNLAAGNSNLLYTYTLLVGGTPVVTANNPNNIGLFTGLAFGTYDVSVTSGRGCIAVQTGILVGQPAPIVLPAPTVTEFGCAVGTNTTNNATIVVNGVSGGNGAPFTYQLLDPLGNVVSSNATPNSFTISNLLGGVYTVNVFDRLGCPATITVPVNPFISLDDINIAITPITCLANEDISITVSTTRGTPVSLVYTVIAIAPITNTYNQTITTGGPGVFTGLPIGDYNITVTNPATGCTITDIHFVNDPNTLDVNVNKVSDAICVGDTSGSVTLTLIDNDTNPTNDAGPFTYAFFLASDTAFTTPLFAGSSPDAGPTLPITGFLAGLYNVRVISPSPLSCPVISSFLIDEPSTPLSLNLDQTLITCAVGNNDGAISAVGQGGWTTAPYEYQLTCTTNALNSVAYSTNGNFQNLNPGTYIVTVRDAKGCPFSSLPIILDIPTLITANVTPGANPLCFGGTTSVTIDNIFGGQGSNYAYTIKGPINSNSDGPVVISGTGPVTINNLVEGNYEVLISDGWLCLSNPYLFTINAPDVVTSSISTTAVQDCAGNATITLTGLGGSGSYSWSTTATGVYTPFISGTTTTFNIVATTVPFQYFVKDTNGCDASSSSSITVAPLTPFITSAVSNNIPLNCVGDSNATINVSALGGLGNYTFTLLQGVTPISNNTTGLFTGLGVGNYTVLVTSGTGIAACPTRTETIVISNPANPFLVDATPFDVTCNGKNDGSIVLVISGATSSTVQYQITSWASGTPDFTNQPPYNLVNNTILNLPPGTYAINVLNGTAGCPVVITGLVIDEPTALDLQIDPLSINQEICSQDNDGAFNIVVSGGILPYSISIDGGSLQVGTVTQTVFQFTGLDGGNHFIKVVDGNLCDSAELTVPLEPARDFLPEAQVNFECGPNNKPFVRVVVLDKNNPPPYDFISTPPLNEYQFGLVLPGVPTPVIIYQQSNIFTSDTHSDLLTPGIYSISVRNTNTCTKETQPFTINPTDVDELTLDLDEGELNEIVANAGGGTQGYTYTFNGIDNGSDNTFIYTYTGEYTVVVTDSSGCTETAKKTFVFIPLCIPNVFTPNGDGQNDGWTPGCSSNYKDLKTYIYDRYGRKIVTLSEGELWDGTYNNQELPSGDYWYVIKVNEGDGREYVGHFTLYR